MSERANVKPYPKEFWEQVMKLVQLGDRSALEVARDSVLDSTFVETQHDASTGVGPPAAYGRRPAAR